MHNSHHGNPHGDAFGFPTWQYEFVRGGALGAATPWYQPRGDRLVWDTSWYGGGGGWSRVDNETPAIFADQMGHTINNVDRWEHVPAVRWICPYDGQAWRVVGELAVKQLEITGEWYDPNQM